MRLVFMLTLTASLLCAAAVFGQSPAEQPADETPVADDADGAATNSPIPLPGRIDRTQIPNLVQDIIRQVTAGRTSGPHAPHQHHTQRAPQNASPAAQPADTDGVQQTSGTAGEVVDVPPPAPAEDLSEPQTIRQRGTTPAPERSVTPEPAPVAPIAGGPYSFRDRLLAKRLARVQQMKQAAAESGDAERMQQAEYLEGMVIELHKEGLFNFAQKFLSAMQEQQSGEAGSDAPAAEIPETDLGTPSALPDAELGQPAPLPGTEAEPIPDLPPEGE